jgi:putative glutamine amidotransferase
MRRPRIGIPLGLDDRGRWRPGHRYQYIDHRYAAAIAQAGGLALQLPIQDDPGALIAELDGLLVPGGDDLPPEPADADLLVDGLRLDLVPEEQLAFDTELVHAAMRRHLPILGICYGMQLMARVTGGRLWSHLPSQCPEAQNHKLVSLEDRHPIMIESDSLLALALVTTTCEVNSLHHQAVSEVGPSHRVVARSPDGVIEAIEGRAAASGFEVGVQWHPEKQDSEQSQRLFAGFVTACRARRGAPETTEGSPG